MASLANDDMPRHALPSVKELRLRHAMPDIRGLGPAWQRRLDDRDELSDRGADDCRVEDGWRGAPHGEDSYW